MIKAIIPCCGFGTRVGMKKNQSKELLPLPGYPDVPMIQNVFNICKQYDLEPLVLVRPEKKDLIAYCRKQKVKMLIMKPGAEWAETVYNSHKRWNDQNILMLPDTIFKPVNKINDIKQSLEMGHEIVFAVHKVSDVSKWGAVEAYKYAEKPTDGLYTHWVKPHNGHAWGLIGFTEESGKELFRNMQTKGLWTFHDVGTNIVFLDSFQDLTRK